MLSCVVCCYGRKKRGGGLVLIARAYAYGGGLTALLLFCTFAFRHSGGGAIMGGRAYRNGSIRGGILCGHHGLLSGHSEGVVRGGRFEAPGEERSLGSACPFNIQIQSTAWIRFRASWGRRVWWYLSMRRMVRAILFRNLNHRKLLGVMTHVRDCDVPACAFSVCSVRAPLVGLSDKSGGVGGVVASAASRCWCCYA